jgi:hypothetical protein
VKLVLEHLGDLRIHLGNVLEEVVGRKVRHGLAPLFGGGAARSDGISATGAEL